MLPTQLTALLDGAPEGIGTALGLVDGVDAALGTGFGRPDDERTAALAALAAAVAASPLGDRVAEAAGKIAAGSVAPEHLTAVAGARAALLGAVHDTLLASLDTALGRDRAPWDDPSGTADAGQPNLLVGVRSWLTEVAITGWRGVDHDLVSSVGQTVEAVLAAPALRRLAVLLDGLAAELRASCPVATMDRLPARRWGDLWTRALLLAQPGPWPGGPATPVSGRLLVLGAEVREHATAVQVRVHGVLEPADRSRPRLVRAAVAAMKVETIVGPSLWKVLESHPTLLAALANRQELDLREMPLLATGDLVWHDDRAGTGGPVDPFATARLLLPGALAAPVAPLDRHPVAIAEPVLVEAHTAAPDGGSLDLGGTTVEVAVDRLPGCGPLTPELVAASSACLGLLRWDAGRWQLDPFAVEGSVKRKPFAAHTGDWALGPTDPKIAKAEAKAGDTVSVLRERAGRLLRKK